MFNKVDWKKSFCGDCKFHVGKECRRFPSQAHLTADYKNNMGFYPIVWHEVPIGQRGGGFYWISACAEFKQGGSRKF